MSKQRIEYINWRSGGGLGLQILATGVLKALREQKPSAVIHAMTSYPEAFVNLPFIDRVYPLSIIPHFYDDHQEYSVIDVNPYTDLDYRMGTSTLLISWCKMIGIKNNSITTCFIELTYEEKITARQTIMHLKIDRPLVAFQPFGGTSYYHPNHANDMTRPRQHRELKVETAQEIVNHLVGLGFAVIHIGLTNEPFLKNCIRLPENRVVNPRELFGILDCCKHGIFVDSFAQHAWAALGKKDAVVLWGATNPETLGYKTNKNLSMNDSCPKIPCNRPNTFMFDFGGNGQPWRCVVGGKCMKFDAEKVIRAFLETNAVDKIKDFEKKLEKKQPK
jgi:ADP-heptose:LPS heptosyltransferase